jgi:hypothetical protein
MIHAITYGPGWSELTHSDCHKLYGWTRDSVAWFNSYVKEDKYDNVSCAIVQGGSDEILVGGDIGISASNSNYYASLTLDADQTNYGYLTHVPTEGTTILLDASPWFWEGYEFLYWEIKSGDGSVWYRDTNAHLERPADTNEYEYYAVFKHPECYPAGC